jgi:hypothetical protein
MAREVAAQHDALGAFNAKYLEPEQVARSFIPPDQYVPLLRTGHTMLVGPRGSGKTTLLKMLLPRAVGAWAHPSADEARSRLSYIGVLIPTDLTWRGQLDATLPAGDDRAVSEVGILAFTTHVLRAVARAAHERIHGPFGATPFGRVGVDDDQERRIAAAVAKAWRLDPGIDTLSELTHALSDRMTSIGEWLQEAREAAAYGESVPRRPPIPHLEYGTAARSLIDRFNDAAGEEDRRWALMFDELELAPGSVIQLLIRSMRGADELLIYKVSLAPYSEQGMRLRSALSASVVHDYQAEQLTYPYKESGYKFARELLAARLGVAEDQVDAETPLGASIFDTQAAAWIKAGTAYGLESRNLARLRRAREQDESFARWLDRREVDLDDPGMDPDQRAATLRKVTSVALLRTEFRTSDEQRTRYGRDERTRETRTVPQLYSGVPSLYAMVEGNPRWFMSLLAPILDEHLKTGKRVDAAAQARHIARSVRRFRLRSYRVGHAGRCPY